jgi:hypothetical protein
LKLFDLIGFVFFNLKSQNQYISLAKSSITLVSYKKVNDYFGDSAVSFISPSASSTSLSANISAPTTDSGYNEPIPPPSPSPSLSSMSTQAKLNKIKENLSGPIAISTQPSSFSQSQTTNSNGSSLNSINEDKISSSASVTSLQQASAMPSTKSVSIKNDLLRKSLNEKINKKLDSIMKNSFPESTSASLNLDSKSKCDQKELTQEKNDAQNFNKQEPSEIISKENQEENFNRNGNYKSMPNLNTIIKNSLSFSISFSPPKLLNTSNSSNSFKICNGNTNKINDISTSRLDSGNTGVQEVANAGSCMKNSIGNCLTMANQLSDPATTSKQTISDQEELNEQTKDLSLQPQQSGGSMQGPSDGSFKSRALYESFRGKVSTLERPRRSKCNSNNFNHKMSLSNTASVCSIEEANKQNASDVNSNTKEKSSNLLTDLNQADDECKSAKKLEKRLTLKKQLTINTDKNSLSSSQPNDILIK